MDYIPHSLVSRIRLYHEEGVGSGGPWVLDGADERGNYTEDCETYPSREIALSMIPAFRKRLSLSDSIPVVEG